MDVGDLPSGSPAGADENDPERLHRIVSHMVARIFDRIPPLRKLSRHAEGADKRSGLVSDLLAAAAELYRRNPDTLQSLAGSYAEAVKERRAQSVASSNGNVNAEKGIVYDATR